MKTIHLIRHAKSSWDHPDLPDAERPLNKRGQRACKAMAHAIRDAGCPFRHVYCSIAKRTQETIERIAASLPGMGITWNLEEDLYTFDWREQLRFIHQLDDSLSEVVLVGHNPATTDFSNIMGDQSIHNVPTCGYVQLAFDTDYWIDVAPTSGKLVTFLTPKGVQGQ